jgi:hypothetical protein
MNAYKKFGFEGYELDPVDGKAMFWQKKFKWWLCNEKIKETGRRRQKPIDLWRFKFSTDSMGHVCRVKASWDSKPTGPLRHNLESPLRQFSIWYQRTDSFNHKYSIPQCKEKGFIIIEQ